MNRVCSNVSARKECLLLAAAAALLAIPAWGQYEISSYTIDGGGGQSAGGPYVVTGTIGQPAAEWCSGGSYEVLGGFWPGGPLCFVEFDDFARFALYWLYTGSDIPADLYQDNTVDFADLRELADNWLFSCPDVWPLK